MSDRNESFPTVAQAAVLLLAVFMVQYLVSAALYDMRDMLGITMGQLCALVMLLGNGLVLAFITHHRGSTYRDLIHPSESSMRITLLLLVPPVLLLVPAVILADGKLNEFLEYLLPLSRWEELAFSGMVEWNLGVIISTCVLAPILEEMLFRGVLLRSFLTQHPRWAAISYSALFFGAAHLNIYQFCLAFLLGLLLGWLFERSRSLIPCIALHAAVNTWVVVAAPDKVGEGRPDLLGDATLATWAFCAVSALIGVWLLRRLFAVRRA